MRATAVVLALVLLVACGGDDKVSGDGDLRGHLVQSGMSADIVDCVIDRADFTADQRDELLSVDDVDDLGSGSSALAAMDVAVFRCAG
jgi:hypothetical protein